MKILLSAFACAPNVGSEGGVGWRWAIELAKQHEVIVITDATRREAIMAELAIHPVTNLKFVFFRPDWLTRVPLNSSTAQILYTAWQFALLPFARRMQREQGFHLAIHCTYSVFRHPSFLGYLGIPFVFGPVGGGEDAPWALKASIRGREKFKELLRSLINKIALFDPFLWMAYAKATLILASTEDTRRALPWPFRRRAIVYSNLATDVPTGIRAPVRQPGEPLRVLFAGRLLGWKGAHLAIRAVAQATAKGVPVEFTLLGKGPFEPELRRVATALGLHDSVRWVSHLPQQELYVLYQTMHCFLFPSLHDSGGTVVLEAQCRGLPVICLDIGGPATLVTPETAMVVATHGLNEAAVIDGLADALEMLAGDEPRRFEMGCMAVARAAATMRWQDRVAGVLTLIGQDATKAQARQR